MPVIPSYLTEISSGARVNSASRWKEPATSKNNGGGQAVSDTASNTCIFFADLGILERNKDADHGRITRTTMIPMDCCSLLASLTIKDGRYDDRYRVSDTL